jgi:hypothetical protein
MLDKRGELSMFGKKKRLVSDAFGEMIYCTYEWRAVTKIPLCLWNKIYYVTPSAITGSYLGNTVAVATRKKREGVNETQKKAYCDFKENIIEKQKEIERVIEKYYDTSDVQVLISKFTPIQLQFSVEGDVGLIADNAEQGGSIIAFGI